ncbi:hypothetical protein Rumeso_00322 [Rubellimicrobium mesophilum DSM 19309]|uniref:Uncharacterized protein n=1 Tax=Rubellimicrobium mesophilum DSM 19309 TaxID=442562 RepID=A0A017HUP6_9RHOB|nr:hypothetical protein [Rubellimicrobium mesophilum]EYD78086.1 hypothetical protein Rumeso_00322 [Rubellimicrobium mesophilum DSM 19309]
MLDDVTLFEALLRESVEGLPPDAPLAMPRQVLERRIRWRRRWLRLMVRFAR